MNTTASLRRFLVPWKLVLAIGMVGLVGYFLLPDAGLQDLTYDWWSLIGAGLVIGGVLLNRPVRPMPWLAIGLGLGLVSVGDWTWTILDRLGESPFPSFADVFYLGGEAIIVLGLLALNHQRNPRGDRAGLLDALILATGVALLTWVTVIEPGAATRPQAGLEQAVSLAYPMLDIVMLSVLARLLLSPGRRVPAFTFLVLAVTGWLVGDLGFLYLDVHDAYVSGNIVDGGWLLGSLCFAVAALHPSMSAVTDASLEAPAFTRRRLVLLALASLMAPLVLLMMSSFGSPISVPIVAGASIALFLLVLARLDGVVAELRRSLGERQQLEDELKRQALHDPLTGLANRTLFGDRLAHALAKRRERVAVLFVDLDDFKTVNDTLGHDAGDQLLMAVARRIRSTLRSGDTAARLGGDEFAVLVEDSPDVRVAGSVAERMLAAIAEPFETDGRSLVVRASVGISLGVAGDTDAQTLMREADIAMYLAKGHGKGRYAVFEATMSQSVVRGFELRSDLEQAIAKQQFLLHYQPVSELLTGRLVGFEALVRWMHPQRGMLAPQEFIPLAEATGLVVPMGRWVLAEACRAAVRLQARLGLPGLFMSVNLSPVQLSGSVLSTDVSDALAISGLASTELLLEVTETALADRTAAARALGVLRSLGVQLAIDDFGTGYSSLGHLAKLPVDIVKMDGSFVHALHEGDRAQALAAGIIGLSHNLGLRVIAEGIEERDQLLRLRELGCELGQGNLLAPPAPEADIVAQTVGAPEQPRRASAVRRQAPAT